MNKDKQPEVSSPSENETILTAKCHLTTVNRNSCQWLFLFSSVSCFFFNKEPQARFSPAVCDGSGWENIHFRNLCVSDKPSEEIIFTPSGWWWEAVCSYWCSKYRNQEDNSPSAPKTILIETSARKWVGVAFQIELWAYICCSFRTLNCANPLTRFELVSDPMETDAHELNTHPADCSLVLIGHG